MEYRKACRTIHDMFNELNYFGIPIEWAMMFILSPEKVEPILEKWAAEHPEPDENNPVLRDFMKKIE